MKFQSITRSIAVALITVMMTLGALQSAQAQTQKEKDIKILLKVSGILDQLGYMKDNLTRSFGQTISFAYPQAPDAFWDDFENVVSQDYMDDLVNRVVVVYDKHMEHEVVLKLIEMFQTPFWAEWREKMPTISREAGAVGSQWAQEVSLSEGFNAKIDELIGKHKLEELNPITETEEATENPHGEPNPH
ncbi:MAG: DUF2059 domain-containing protein [Candidatus Nitrohelix vancouverensis]|uniref:DUF2059 domain-containing protein n=1 Tax=Candidatus Nitrohelix vancouverensis TaxID=2705534 RepID=A0A7T0C110_9BACT|nr:MAG: DUF2059 domain-containing protein [Candidatus Nitrohelix vancouverensis]